MREILFRGKRIDNGEWVTGYLFRNDNYLFPMALIGSVTMSRDKYTGGLHFDGFELYEVDPDTVGQYTGLDDKNGVKIFEGDILNIKLVISHDDFTHTEIRRKWRTSVIYENGAFKITEEGETYPLCEYILSGINQAWFEVIGNIQDN